jgi:hypothetical protein
MAQVFDATTGAAMPRTRAARWLGLRACRKPIGRRGYNPAKLVRGVDGRNRSCRRPAVLADVLPDQNIDPEVTVRAITPRTRAAMPPTGSITLATGSRMVYCAAGPEANDG